MNTNHRPAISPLSSFGTLTHPRPSTFLTPLRFSGAKSITPCLFDESAGIQVSGDAGTGKSTLLCNMIVAVARMGYGCTLLDPHGDLQRKVKRILLAEGPSVRRRVYDVCPGNASMVTTIDPLAVDSTGIDEHTAQARLIARCGHNGRILLHAWGETDFNSKPLLYKWTNRLLHSTAISGLPFAGVRHFLEVGSPVYEALTAALPDYLTRLEFAELGILPPARREEIIGSTKNRFLGFLSNPKVEFPLSRTEGAFNGRQLVQDNAIILGDLAPHGVLREEDQEILANLWLSEILHAIFSTPEHERVPHFIFIDELPVFASCAPLITATLRQCRKFLTRFVCAHQGTVFFKDRTDDPLLHALVSQCGVHFYFRHIDPLDAKFFGEIVALPSLSPTKPKHVLTQDQQYQDGYGLAVLTDVGENWSQGKTAGGGYTTGTNYAGNWSSDRTEGLTNTDSNTVTTGRTDTMSQTDAQARTDGTGHTDSQTHNDARSTHHDDHHLRRAVTEAQADSRGSASASNHSDTSTQTQGTSQASSTTQAHGTAVATQVSHRTGTGGSRGGHQDRSTNWSVSREGGHSRTRKQTLLPRLKWRQVVTAIQFLTSEEQNLQAASMIASQQIGQALLYLAGRGVAQVTIPLLPDPLRLTPRFASRQEQLFLQQLLRHPAYASPATIHEERHRFAIALVARLQELATPAAQRSHSTHMIAHVQPDHLPSPNGKRPKVQDTSDSTAGATLPPEGESPLTI